MLAFAGPAAHGLYFSSTDVPPRAQPPAGRRFARDIGTFDTPVFGVLPAGQTTELLLDAIARSDGTRASVLEKFVVSPGADMRAPFRCISVHRLPPAARTGLQQHRPQALW